MRQIFNNLLISASSAGLILAATVVALTVISGHFIVDLGLSVDRYGKLGIVTGHTSANVLSFPGVDPSGASDSTQGLNNAIVLSCGSGQALKLPTGTYKFTNIRIDPAQWSDCQITGDGRALTILEQTASGNGLAFNGSGSQKLTLRDISIREKSNGLKTSGYALVLSGLYYPQIENVEIGGYNGILDNASATAQFTKINFGYLNGSEGIRFIGNNNTSALFGAVLDDVTGTTAQSGGVSDNHKLIWLDIDSYSYSVTVKHAAFMYGMNCVSMRDSVGAASNASVPRWLFVPHIECDHQFGNSIDLKAGSGFSLGAGSWVGSSTTGQGISQQSGYVGQTFVEGTRINGNFAQGIAVYGGVDWKFVDNTVTANGSGAGGTHYDEIYIASGVSHGKLLGNFVGQTGNDGNSSADNYGIDVAPGSGDYLDISNNDASGSRLGAISNRASGAHNTIDVNPR